MTRGTFSGIVIGLCVLLFCGPQTAVGQAVYGSIVGTVTDSSGAAIPNAKVTITDVDKGVSFNINTNEAGNYSQLHLIVGTYEVRVEASGFATAVQKTVQVNVDTSTQVNIELRVGNVDQVLAVTAEVPLLKTQRSDVSHTITTQAAVELPVFQRDLNRLYFLIPGVQAAGTTAASEQPHALFRPTVSGQYWGGISFQLDGTDNRESVLGEPVITPGLDALSEMKVTTQSYDAEFGQANQGVISLQTKSGTNELHGSAFEFRRDQHGQARDPFAQSQPIVGTSNTYIPPTLWNQFGGSLGGPIQHDKTFIFGDYQGSRQKNGGSLLTRVPNAAERTGDLSGLGVNIFDPCNGSDCTIAPANRLQFPGNKIPANRLSSQAVNLLNSIPLPNVTSATGATPNYVSSGFGVLNSDLFDIRVDRYQTDKVHMFGRYSFMRYDQSNPGAFGYAAGGNAYSTTAFAGAASLRNQSLAYGVDYMISPTWVADFRFGFFRYRVFVNPNGLGTSPAKDAGIPGLNLDNYYTSGMPAFNLTGTGGFQFGYSLGINSCNCPLNEQENQYQWVGNVTHIRGNHSIKMGADWRFHQNLRVPSDTHRSGELAFDAVTTSGPNGGGLSLASFLTGNVQTFGRYVSNSTDAAERQNRFFTYVQDTWRITSKLTLNYGIRWEIYFPQFVNGDSKGGFVNLDTGEVWIAGTNGVGMNGNINTALTHFAPRLGLSWQATPKFVVRAGYGRSYDVGVFGSTFGHNVTQNPPVLAIQNVNPANPWLPVFNLAQGPPAVLDPGSILANQPKGPNGFPILPAGIQPNVLPLTSDRTMRLPVVDAYNLTVERQLTPTIVLSVAYVGNKGTHVFPGGSGQWNINQPNINGFGTLTTNQRRLFYQKYGWNQNIKYFSNDASNHFNSMQVHLEKRFSGGLFVQGNYTWASAFDFESAYYFWNHDIGYGRESNLRLHVFTASQVYDLPFGKKGKFFTNPHPVVNGIIGGWQINGVWTWESGLPYTPSYLNFGQDSDTGSNRANLVGDPSVPNPSAAGWFAIATPGTSGQGCVSTANATSELNANGCTRGPWQRPAKGTFGNATRNGFFGPHFFMADMSLLKNFDITERYNLQFRIESFNTFNHVNLGQPTTTVDSPTAGRIFAIANLSQMRKWQFGLRFKF